MNIREINTNGKFATVTFDYDELRCLCNSLYEVSKFDDVEKDDNFNNVYAKIIELFALVKHGKIPEFELKKMYELFYGKDHPTEKVCTGKRCPMQVGYDVKNCKDKDCIYRTETEKAVCRNE